MASSRWPSLASAAQHTALSLIYQALDDEATSGTSHSHRTQDIEVVVHKYVRCERIVRCCTHAQAQKVLSWAWILASPHQDDLKAPTPYALTLKRVMGVDVAKTSKCAHPLVRGLLAKHSSRRLPGYSV